MNQSVDLNLELSSGTIGGREWALRLGCNVPETADTGVTTVDGRLNTTNVSINQLDVLEGDVARISFKFATKMDVPISLLVNVAKGKFRLKTADELRTQLEAVADTMAARFKALCAEAFRRFRNIEIDVTALTFLGVANPQHGAGVGAAARARLELGLEFAAGSQPALTSTAELVLVVIAEAVGVRRMAGLACVLRAGVAPRLRLELDDLHFEMPEVELPALEFSKAAFPNLDLGALKGSARALASLIGQTVSATVTATAPVLLAIRQHPTEPRFEWAIVDAQLEDVDWEAADFGGHLLAFDATLELQEGDTFATIEDAKVSYKGIHTANITPGSSVGPLTGTKRLGPLQIEWDDVKVTPSLNVGDGQPSLRARISFQRLLLRAHADPEAVIAFSGELEVTASGVEVMQLDMVEPFPYPLVLYGAGAIARQASRVVRVIADLANATVSQIKQLLDVLGRIATAIARALVYVGEALVAVGEFLAKALVAIAEFVGALLKKLADLFDDGEVNCSLAFELRIGTDPLELRQVLLTARSGTSKARKLDALGFRLALPADWQPGLLLDLVNEPGAYLVMRPTTVSNFAILSTDLWLKQEQQLSAVRDADPKEGERPVDPLLSIRVKPTTAAELMVVLVGLRRGEPFLLKKLAGTVIDASPQFPQVKTIEGPITLSDLKAEDVEVNVEFQTDRVLPLLGMGDTGKDDSDEPSFLDRLKNSLANVVWIKGWKNESDLLGRKVKVGLELGLKAAGLETSLTLKGNLSLDTFELQFESGNTFNISSKRIEERGLGLTWIIEQTDIDKRRDDEAVDMFKLGFGGGQSYFEMNKANARMELRFEGLSSDGKGVAFEVDTFRIGPGGLDLTAKAKPDPVRLSGIDVPFRFTSGGLEIKGGKLVQATIVGHGSLPPRLIGEADCTLALTFGEDPDEGIVLQSGTVELDKKGDPIVCHASRFTLTITDLGISIVKDGGYHFFYLVTGSLRFTPGQGEFESGLLQYLDGVEMNLERTPLAADPRVLLKHISFQKALNPKKTFNLFNLFTFELRGFGYHPAAPKFGGEQAVNISGQIKFAEIGDIMQPNIDFHGLWIAPPKTGESLPRIKADGLGIDLNLKGSIRVKGEVIAVDRDSRTVEGFELAPDGYNAYGFLGRGEFEIPGWGNMAANLGFLELESAERPGERRKTFYFYGEQRKVAIEIPTPIWTFWLRDWGGGLALGYTLEALAAADRVQSIPALIKTLEVSKWQGDLHKFSAWRPGPDGDRVTLALKGAIQTYPAERTWDQKREEQVENPFLFDLVAAIRSDFTLFMGLRGWLATNYADYLADREGLRSKPGLRGYLYISAPQKRLLARMIADPQGYIGERVPALARNSDGSDPPLRRALKSTDFSATLFIKPGLFHYELGWPNQLAVRLVNEPNMRVTVRGGMIFRAAEDGLLWGYNIEADAFFRFGGSRQIGPIGVCAEATLDARLVARVLCYLSWRFKGSLIYGLISLDANLRVSVKAWMEIDLGIKTITIKIGFSVSLQFSAAIELALSTEGIGARVHARVAISAFGTTLSVSVGFTIGGSQLEAARARVQRFLAMSITAEEPDASPAIANKQGDKRVAVDAEHAEAVVAPPPAGVVIKNPHPDIEGKAAQRRAQYADVVVPKQIGVNPKPSIPATEFWLVLRRASGSDDQGYALLIPINAENASNASFYAAPYLTLNEMITEGGVRKVRGAHKFEPALTTPLKGVKRFVPGENWTEELGNDPFETRVRWDAPLSAETVAVTLAHAFDECFLSDTEWAKTDKDGVFRITTAWGEPAAYGYHVTDPEGRTEEERVAQRDLAQRQRSTDALNAPLHEAARQARSSMLAMFLDQFSRLADGDTGDDTTAHVRDLGLVFKGPIAELERLAQFKVQKIEGGDDVWGDVVLFNPRDTWFDIKDPVLGAGRHRIASDGIKLDWRLVLPFDNQRDFVLNDPDQYLHHYEIVRTIEGREFSPRVQRVKPAATIGGRINGSRKVELLRPEWQYTDDLADLDHEQRTALLPTDEENALSAAVAWATHFGNEEDAITVTYSVTPVDIAGSRGLPKSFLVEVQRPQAPVRPAEAELRFVVNGLGKMRRAPVNDITEQVEGYADDKTPDQRLGVVLMLRDRSFSKESKDVGGCTVTRSYVLIADPEDILPSGHYGTNGLTERRLAPQTGAGPVSADALQWWIKTKDFIDVTKPSQEAAAALEPDPEVRASFPYWRRLAGLTQISTLDKALQLTTELGPIPPFQHTLDFISSLWRRPVKDGVRIATRFSLVTVHHVTDKKTKKTEEFRSKAVPVGMEVRVEPLDFGKGMSEANGDIGLIRPETFEWPVHLTMPPHGPGQVGAQSGFARFRVPDPDHPTLNDLLVEKSLPLMRDPERRVLTTVQFDAGANKEIWKTAGLDGIHASTIAGYDLHELDIDDLAPLDTDLSIHAHRPTWQRARRVARIERVSPETARLTPDGNNDWRGWQAQYPSEAWRVLHRVSRPNQSRPIRAPWYSPAESTIRFAERYPRLRLLPTAPEMGVSDLLMNGLPEALYVRFVRENEKNAEEPWKNAGLRLANLFVDDVLADERSRVNGPGKQIEGNLIGDVLKIERTKVVPIPQPVDIPRLQPAHVRAALLRLAWSPDEKTIKAFTEDPSSLDGLVLHISWSKTFDKGTLKIPLRLGDYRHPILDEVLGELEYDVTTEQLYRRFVVTAQPVKPSEDASLAAFLDTTMGDKDPYGWSALQTLGLATTIRMFDRDKDEFLDAHHLLQRVNDVMTMCVKRYVDHYSTDDLKEPIGVPMVDVLLRPGTDRVAGPFDAVLPVQGADGSAELDLADQGLAIAQISLRPQPAAGRKYWRLDIGWEQGSWPRSFRRGPVETVDNDGNYDVHTKRTIDHSLIACALTFNPAASGLAYEVMYDVEDKVQTVLPGQPATFKLRGLPTEHVDAVVENPNLRFFVRSAPKETIDFKASDSFRVHIRTRTITERRYFLAGTEIPAFNASEFEDKTTDEWMTLRQWFVLLDRAVPKQGIRRPLEGEPRGDRAGFEEANNPTLPGKSTPFRRFTQIAEQHWRALLRLKGEHIDDLPPGLPNQDDTSVLVDCLDSLRQNLRHTLPDLIWPYGKPGDKIPYNAMEPIMGTYLDWSQRFLDHTGMPTQGGAHALQFALAAPIKAHPWQLAADRHGRITISFLHSDRWAHARAYAVQPTGRYQNLALGAGHFVESTGDVHVQRKELSEQLFLPKDKKINVGYALAVSPRTERIEPPTFLGTRIVRQGDHSAWELVVARHGEESLAASNRSLFARLGTEGTALSFVRAYREPEWPARLNSRFNTGEPKLYPVQDPALPIAIPGPPPGGDIDGKGIRDLACRHPSLWKGADVWRIDGLAPHYRVTALAVARAGIVVSRVVSQMQDATPRRPLSKQTKDVLGPPRLEIDWIDSGDEKCWMNQITIHGLRLVAHQDLSEVVGPDQWDDVAWWPDPDVTYTLQRYGTRSDGVGFDEEDAVIRMIPRHDPKNTVQNDDPVVLRCRGNRFQQGVVTPEVVRDDNGGRSDFHLAFHLRFEARHPTRGAASIRYSGADVKGWAEKRASFNEVVGMNGFAHITGDDRLILGGFKDAPSTEAEAKQWLLDHAARVDADALLQDHLLKNALIEIAVALRAEADALNGEPDVPHLQRPREYDVRNLPHHLPPRMTPPLSAKLDPLMVETLTLRGVVPDKIAAKLRDTGHPIAGEQGGALWPLCRERLLGAAKGFRIRALDTRNALEGNDPVGELDVDVDGPIWTNWTL